MKLQGRNLSDRMKGEDIKLLQSELRKLGYRIPAAETSKQFFGASTRQAVLDFQKKHRLKTTGVVDERTAKRINAEVTLTATSLRMLARWMGWPTNPA